MAGRGRQVRLLRVISEAFKSLLSDYRSYAAYMTYVEVGLKFKEFKRVRAKILKVVQQNA